MFTLPTAVEAPTDVLGHQPIPNTLHVIWTPPSPLGHATGYRIYYNGDDGSSGTLDVSGSMSHSQVLRGLSSGVSYTLSVVALSVHLPSPVAQHGQPIPISEQSLFVSISKQYYYIVSHSATAICDSGQNTSYISQYKLERILWSRSLWNIVWESHRRAARGTLSQSISLWSGQSQCSYHHFQHNWSGGVQYLPHHSDCKTRKTLVCW